MPDFPDAPAAYGDTLFYSIVTEWVRRTGRVPSYASATFDMSAAGGIALPVRVERKMTARALYVWNGASVNGSHQMGLFRDNRSTISALFPVFGVLTEPTPQAGTSQWQRLDIDPFVLAPGIYHLVYASSSNTGTVQKLYAPAASGSGEAIYPGFFTGYTYPISGSFVVGDYAPIVPVMAVGGIAA
jgi:hypothetical protein